ncbi:hypothetical protein G6F57_013277 [Rhizopus arrhizus]|nr:hypothetical protein G6F57_013277 [Rhizopus arrhizus]
MPLVVAQHAILLGAEAGDGGARGGVEPAGFQHHADAAQHFEGVLQQQQLGFGIGAGALRARRVPGVAETELGHAGVHVVETGAADDVTGGIADHERQPLAFGLRLQRGLHIGLGLLRRRHLGIPELVQAAAFQRGTQAGDVFKLQRLQQHVLPAQCGDGVPGGRVAHRSALQARGALGAVIDIGLDAVDAVGAEPEHLPVILLVAAVGLSVVEVVDRIAVARAPEQLRRFFQHHVPDRAAQAFALRIVQHGELVQVHAFGFIGEDDRSTVVLADVGAQQPGLLEIVRHQGAAEAGFDQLLQARQVQLLPCGGAQHLLALAHQRARALVGEQFLGQVGRTGDRHRRFQRQAIEQILDLFDLHLHATVDPRLRDQVVVLGGQVDRIDHVAGLVQQATGTGQEDDLVRLQLLHQLVGGEIGIHVEDLATGGLAQAGDDRNRAGTQAGFDRRQVDLLHLADQAVGVHVQVFGLEHATGNRGGARAVLLKSFDQAQIGLLEHPAHDRQRFRRGHAQTVDGLLLDAGGRQLGIQLRASAVQHDRAPRRRP